MRGSLGFAATLIGVAFACGAASVVGVEWQEKRQAREMAQELAGGNVDAGKAAIARYGCGGCHQIPGIDGADGGVGPSLKGLAVRAQFAGRLANQPDNLTLWIRKPQQVDPGNGMPDLGVGERDARDMAAYLYTLTKEQ